MVNITEEQKKYLSSLINNIEGLLTKDSDEPLLLAIDNLIINEYDDQQENLSERGVQLQKIYDEIFAMND